MPSPDGEPSTADQLDFPATRRSLRQLPSLAGGSLRLVLAAARRPFLLTVALQALSGVLLAVEVLAGQRLLSHVLVSSRTGRFAPVVPWIVILAAVFAVGALVAVGRLELQRLLGEMVSRFALQRVLDTAAGTDLIHFEDPEFHDRLQRATVNAASRPYQMTSGLLTLGTGALSSTAVAVTLATIEPLLLVLALLAVIPVIVVSVNVGRALYRFAVEQTPADRQRSYIQLLVTSKESAKEVQAYGLAPHLLERYAALSEQRLGALRRVIRTRVRQGAVGALISGLATGATLGLLVLFVSDGRVSLAGAGAAAAALLLLATQLQGVAGGVGSLFESALFIRDFTTFIGGEPPRPPAGPGAAPAVVGRIDVRGLGFTYPSRPEPTLHDIDLFVAPGEVVALVGENGSGKTTLAKLLAGLYEPGTGTITWAGEQGPPQPAATRPRVAILFQDFVRYFFSAHANIALGAVEHYDDRRRVETAARRAGADAFVSGLPSGYETLLGPQFFGGSDLSGGQWQRVALARAFFRDAGLVILDEPTAALDPRAEAELFASVRSLFDGRSVVLISHRFASVRLADRIYVLGGGRVVEQGNHDELMAADGLYAELFRLQAAAFGDADPQT